MMAPRDVALLPSTDLLVADTDNRRVQRLSSVGEPRGIWGPEPDQPGEFTQPVDVAVGDDGSVAVADAADRRLRWFAPDERFVSDIGRAGTGPDGLGDPAALAAGPNQVLYVADARYDRVLAFGPILPDGWRATHYDNPWLAGVPTRMGYGDAISLALAEPDFQSARFDRHTRTPLGTYALEVRGRGGVRLWWGRKLVIDAWDDASIDLREVQVVNTAAEPWLRVEYRPPERDAVLEVDWDLVAEAHALWLPTAIR